MNASDVRCLRHGSSDDASVIRLLLQCMIEGPTACLVLSNPARTVNLFFDAGRLHIVTDQGSGTRFGDMLVERGLIAPGEVDKAAAEATQAGRTLVEHLIVTGRIPPEALMQTLDEQAAGRIGATLHWPKFTWALYEGLPVGERTAPLTIPRFHLVNAVLRASYPPPEVERRVQAFAAQPFTLVLPEGHGAWDFLRPADAQEFGGLLAAGHPLEKLRLAAAAPAARARLNLSFLTLLECGFMRFGAPRTASGEQRPVVPGAAARPASQPGVAAVSVPPTSAPAAKAPLAVPPGSLQDKLRTKSQPALKPVSTAMGGIAGTLPEMPPLTTAAAAGAAPTRPAAETTGLGASTFALPAKPAAEKGPTSLSSPALRAVSAPSNPAVAAVRTPSAPSNPAVAAVRTPSAPSSPAVAAVRTPSAPSSPAVAAVRTPSAPSSPAVAAVNFGASVPPPAPTTGGYQTIMPTGRPSSNPYLSVPGAGESTHPWPAEPPASGDIAKVSLPEVIQEVLEGHHSGVLHIRSRGIDRSIIVDRGVPQSVTSHEVRDEETLGAVLKQMSKLPKNIIDQAIQRCLREKRKIGEILVEEQHLSPMQVLRALVVQSELKIINACAAETGTYEWVPTASGGGLAPALSMMNGVQLLYKAARQKFPAERARLRLIDLGGEYPIKEVGDSVLRNSVPLPPPDLKLFKDCVDGVRSIEDICRISPVGRVNTYRALYAFWLLGWVSFASSRDSTAHEGSMTAQLQKVLSKLSYRDPFRVLGVHWSSGDSAINAVRDDYYREYGPGSARAQMSPDVGALCTQIIAKVDAACEQLRTPELRQAARKEHLDPIQMQQTMNLELEKAMHVITLRRDYAEALPMFQAVAEVYPNRAEALAGYAFCLHHTGRAGEAGPYASRALALAPDNPTVKAFLTGDKRDK